MSQSAGDVIGDRYRLIEKIGEGGMATVWEAEHVALGSRLAVKFLHRTAPQGSETAQRFLREARVAASVKHRNVVDINDFGFTDDEVPYMVMERLVGESLADFLHQRGPIELDEAARLASLTLRGLAAVHDAGIVHRDLKPDNVFLVRDEDGNFPKLLDFGLSRRAGRTDMTIEGTLMGTPDYMSPEQARGHTDLDARTDIYSMGVMLYEMIAARMPYESELVGDLIAMISRDPPTPVTTYRPDTPREMVEVIERAMAKNRDERFPDAREMRAALVELWGGFADPGSGLTSLSEMPTSMLENPNSGLLPRPTPNGGMRRPTPPPRRSTASGARANPVFPRPSTGSFAHHEERRSVAHGPVLGGAEEPTGGGMLRSTPGGGVPREPGLELSERLALGDAPTMSAMPAMEMPPSPYPARAPAEEPRSTLASLLALSLAAAAGATFVWVWIANGDNTTATLGSSGEEGANGAAIGGDDAGVGTMAAPPAQDAGWDAGVAAQLDAGDHEEVDEVEPPTKRRPIKRRRARRPTKRRGRGR